MNKRLNTKNMEDLFSFKKCILFFIFSGLIIAGLYKSIIMIAVALCIIIYLFIAPLQTAFELTLFLLPFTNIFKISITSVSFFTFIWGGLLIKIILTEKINTIHKRSILLYVFLLAYAVFSIFYSLISTINFIVGITFLLLVFGSSFYTNLLPKRIVFYFAYGIILASIWGLLKTYIIPINEFLNIYYYRLENGSIVYRFSGLCKNSNYYTIDVSIALAALLTLFMRKQIEVSFYIISVPLIAFGIMAQSKTFFVSLVIWIIYTLSYMIKKRSQLVLRFLIITIVVFAVAYKPVSSFFNNYFARILDFSNNSSINDLTTGRWNIWSAYISYIFSNIKTLLVGEGISTKWLFGQSHNLFIQLLYNFGLIGTYVYFIYVISLINTKYEFKLCIPIILIFIIRAFTANILFYDNTYFYLFILLLLINSKSKIIRT